MAYQYFRITEGPKRVQLTVPPELGQAAVPFVLNKAYDMGLESELVIDPFLGYPGEPLDNFKYQIKPNSTEPWSDNIDYEINVTPEDGTPNCQFKSLAVEASSTADITHLFPFDTSTDRIRINSIEGLNRLKIDGQPVEFGKTYMRYHFVNVTFVSGTPYEDVTSFMAKLNYTMGRLTGWGNTCEVTLTIDYKAKIVQEGPNVATTTEVFTKKFRLKNGVPLTNMRVEITCYAFLTYFELIYYDQSGITQKEHITSGVARQFDLPIQAYGMGLFTLKGTSWLGQENKPYLFTINAKILSSDGNPNLVHPIENEVEIPVYSDAALLNDFNIINGVLMTSDSFTDDYGVDSYEAIIETPPAADVDMQADIFLYSGQGTAPFTYALTYADLTAVGITVDPITISKFLIEGLLGDGTGIKHEFLATVTDANNVISTYPFDVTIKEQGVQVTVPTISAPADLTLDEALLVNEQIVASNGPILSYSASGLPAGLSVNTNSGIISGFPTATGVFPVTLTATNSAGVSANYTWTITVNAVADVAPVLTSAQSIVAPVGTNVNYLIEYTGTEPVTVQVVYMPEGWTFDVNQMRVKGYMSQPFTSFRIVLKNSVRQENYLVSVNSQA